MTGEKPADTLEAILELARWAPSGDNEQPWRFECLSRDHVVVHGYDTREECVYDRDGSASQIALGALIETMSIAASLYGMRVEASRRRATPIETPLIDVRLIPDADVVVDSLAECITTRSVHRRPLRTRPLTPTERSALEAAVAGEHRIVWRDGWRERARMAGLLFRSAKLRLTMPEAYLVHRDAIEWGAQFSIDRVPEAAVGLDPATARIMRWVMKSWPRVVFFNRYLAGTWAPRLQLDLLPALACAGHFFLIANNKPSTIDDFIAGGRAVQRFWLMATRLGLQLQPEVTPLIFARYARNALVFSRHPGTRESAEGLALRLEKEIGAANVAHAVFMGRVGDGPAAKTRSLRLPLESLLIASDTQNADQKLCRNSA